MFGYVSLCRCHDEGLTDKYSYVTFGNPGYWAALPLDVNYLKKPAYYSIEAALKGKWSINEWKCLVSKKKKKYTISLKISNNFFLGVISSKSSKGNDDKVH